MQSEEEYFGEARAIASCSVCGIELYYFDTIYDCDFSGCLCEECVDEHLGLKQDDDELFEPTKCPHCNSILTDEYESVTVDGERFCDKQCAYLYLDVEIIEA